MMERLLKRQIEQSNEMIASHKKRISEIEVLICRERLLKEEAIDILQDICTHENEETTTEYSEGGYDYKSCTTYTSICTNCGKVLDTRNVTGGFQ